MTSSIAVAMKGSDSSLLRERCHRPLLQGARTDGRCLLALGRPIQAVVPLAAASALNDQVRAPSLLSQSFLAIGDYERAGKWAATVLARSPGNRVARAVAENQFVQRVLMDGGALRRRER